MASQTYDPFFFIQGGDYAIRLSQIADIDFRRLQRYNELTIKMSSGTEYTLDGEDVSYLMNHTDINN